MKLAKSLLLGSAAALAATVSAQAADLPVRKAAPVEYVRVCDFTGAGYFYIPGSDTCLRIGGFVRAEFEYNSGGRAYAVPNSAFAQPSSGGNHATGTGGAAIAAGFISGRNRDETGFFVRGRLEADARTQTAYGTLRTFVRYQMDKYSGAENYVTAYPSGSGNGAYIDKAFVQFAGITAGRVQSFFDFGADPYGFEGVATTDSSTQVFAYTATLAGGFSATIAAEDPNVRRFGINNSLNGNGTTTAQYAGDRIPDIVGQVNYSPSWGQAQLSAAYHEVNTTSTDLINKRDDDGFAVRGGVQVKLPFLAAGDEFQVEAGYQSGAYSYQNSNLFDGGYGNPIAVGGFQHPSVDAIAIAGPNGSYRLAKADGYSISGGFQHYLTPQFFNIVFGSYEQLSYGGAKNIPYYFGGVGNGSEYRIADQFDWNPVKNLLVGLEVMYIKTDQKVPGLTAATPLPQGIRVNPEAFEGRLRIERDF